MGVNKRFLHAEKQTQNKTITYQNIQMNTFFNIFTNFSYKTQGN